MKVITCGGSLAPFNKSTLLSLLLLMLNSLFAGMVLFYIPNEEEETKGKDRTILCGPV